METCSASASVPSIDKLSKRERQVMPYVLLGKTDQEIATILNISPRTARYHVENAKAKAGVVSRATLAVWYDRQVPEAFKLPICGEAVPSSYQRTTKS
jgi:DNA-binding CsgD family transcriptional regulator